MNSKNLTLIIILLVILLFGGCACGRYNGLVTADQAVKTAWSDVETNYQRRTDLYNSVIKVIEGSANFEKSTLTAVIAAAPTQRPSMWMSMTPPPSVNTSAPRPSCRAPSATHGRCGSLSDLKTTQQFQNFQTQIEGTENRINVARRDFNAAVQDYNLKVKTFPNNIFAGIFGFHEKPITNRIRQRECPGYSLRYQIIACYTLLQAQTAAERGANQQIVAAIGQAERQTSGEIRVFVESRCRFVNPLDRAAEVFTGLKMDQTAQRNAVLVYVALKDRQLALYGDKGIHEKVGDAFWNTRSD